MTEAVATAEQQRALALKCPKCGAEAGTFCIRSERETEALRNRGQVHRIRYMMAVTK